MRNKKIGELGEKLAEQILISKGYRIIKKNFNCPFGEIDIIALKEDVIAFVEVKTRLSDDFGTGLEAVRAYKKRHIRNSANYYLSITGWHNKDVDFQVIEISAAHIDKLYF